jgi:hypothetical protein
VQRVEWLTWDDRRITIDSVASALGCSYGSGDSKTEHLAAHWWRVVNRSECRKTQCFGAYGYYGVNRARFSVHVIVRLTERQVRLNIETALYK